MKLPVLQASWLHIIWFQSGSNIWKPHPLGGVIIDTTVNTLVRSEFDSARMVNFMVSLKSYRIQFSSVSCNYKSKMNLLYLFSQNALYLVHAMFGGVAFVVLNLKKI